jgi:hypothetical protein
VAIVHLTIAEAQGELPPICMICGNEAHEVVRKKMSWKPGWVWLLILFGLIPFLLVALMLTKRAVLQAPLCPLHKNHWSNRTLAVALGFFAVIGLVFVVILFSAKPWAGFLAVACLGLGLVWAIATIFITGTAIRARRINDAEVVLQNVSPDFAYALGQYDMDVPG